MPNSLSQTTLFQDCVNFEDKLRLDEVFFRVLYTQILYNLFDLLQASLNQFYIPARRFPSRFRFLLESMEDIHYPVVRRTARSHMIPDRLRKLT